MANGGKFITLEGCEGVGKSTQVRYLKEYCANNGIDAVFTREPGGTDTAEKIRKVILDSPDADIDPIAELLLYTASRRQHTQELILPGLEQGKIVFCDRYTDSTLAYQGYARGLDIALIERLNALAMGELKIDLTLFLNLSPDDGFKRKGGADKTDRLESEGLEFHKKVYKGFCELSRKHTDRIVSIDVSGTKTQTHNKIINVLKQKGIF